jgi:Transglycosylase SLT domain
VAVGFKIADAYVDVSVDEDALDAGIADVEAKLAAIPDKMVGLGLDAGGIPAQVAEIMAALRALAADIPLNLNQSVIDAQIADIKAKFDAMAFDIPANIDEGALDIELADILAKIQALRELFVDIPVELDMESLTLSAAKAIALLRSLPSNIDITFETDDGPLVLGIAKAKALLAAMPGTMSIEIKVDDGSIVIAGAEIAAFAASVDALYEAMDMNLQRTKGPLAAAISGTGLLGQSWLTTAHWIVLGTAEILAVVLPATVALGSWFAVWLQGATNVYDHMTAVYGATEATANIFGETAGQAVGLGDALQKAQNAANPDVYQVLGAAVDLVREHFSDLAQVGLQVGQIFDTFAAKLVYDFSSAGGAGALMNNLLARMVPDLVELGQVFGGLGHELLILAGQMPGLAAVLLDLLSLFIRGAVDVTTFLSKIGLFGVSIITAVIGIEEFMRWGGLLLGMLGAMGSGFDGFSTRFLSFTRFQEVFTGLVSAIPGLFANATQALADFAGKFEVLGGEEGPIASGLGALSTKIDSLTLGMGLWEAAIVVVAAVGLAILIDKIVTAQTAAQVFADKLQAAALAASNMDVLNTITDNVSKLNAQLAPGATNARNAAYAVQQFGEVAGRYTGAVGGAQNATGTFSAALKQQGQDTQNVITGALYLADTYHTTLTGGMELATAANVKLVDGITGQGAAAFIARQQIADLVQGYESMGAPVTAVGNDILALGIQSGLAGTKVSGLEQAWQQFMTNLTGGEGGLAQFEVALGNIGTVAADNGKNLSTSTGQMTLSVQQFAAALKTNIGGTSSAAWNNFSQIVGSTAPQLINWFQTAGAEGAISGKNFTQAVATMVSQLLPFASESAAATAELSGLAQMAGGPATSNFQTLKGWVDQNKVSTKDYNDIVNNTTIAMSDMSKMAQNLGTVLQSEITNMMDTARLATSGADGAINTYTKDLEDNTANTAQGHADRAALISDLEKAGLSSAVAEQDVDALTKSITGNTSAANSGENARTNLINDLKKAGLSAQQANTLLSGFSTEISNTSNTAAEKRQARLDLIQDLENSGVNAKTATTLVDNYITALTKIPKSESTAITATGKGTWSIAEAIATAQYHQPGGTAALGMFVKGGIPGVDSVPLLAMEGEAVVPRHLVPLIAPLLKAHGVPGFASGGLVGLTADPSTVYQQTNSQMITGIENAIAAAIKAAEQSAMSGVSGNVKSFAPVILQVLQMLGQSSSDLGVVERQMTTESGGNEDAVNKTDINWQEGHPSVGLMQVIQGTFDAYAGQFVNTGPFLYGVSTNPMANIYAGLNYAVHRYGPGWTSVLGQGHGYASGGVIPEPVWGVGASGQSYSFAENGPETVTPGARGGINVNFYGTQYPTNEQIVALKRQLQLSTGVGP